MTVSIKDALSLIQKRIRSHKKPFVIAIDGRSASGKTTFAQALGCPVIHTDDFYRPRNEEGELDISEFDGNFDYARFKTEIVGRIGQGKAFSYGVFDCALGKISSSISVPDFDCIAVEGAYSLNPRLGDYADMKIFFDVSKDVQAQRIEARNGREALSRFKEIWIPAEERYFLHYNIQRQCEITVSTEV